MMPSELRLALQVLTADWGRGESLRSLLTLVAVAERQPLPQSALQNTLGGVDATAVFLIVKRLAAHGLISSAISPTHRSHRLLSLTPAGEELLRDAGIDLRESADRVR